MSNSGTSRMAKGITLLLVLFISFVLSLVMVAAQELTIQTPDNSSALTIGEDLHLNFTSDDTIRVNYSLDGITPIPLGNGTSFLAPLMGVLDYDVVANGNHGILIGIDHDGDITTHLHSFVVNDDIAPILALNITNGSSVDGPYLELTLLVISSEYGLLSHNFNGEGFSLTKDFGEDKYAILNLTPQEGANVLDINVSDVQGNHIIHHYEFDFTPTGRCDDAIQNGQETGIDCGGNCPVCIPFDVTTNKATYETTETPTITVLSREFSVVNVTIRKEGEVVWRHEFKPAFSGSPIFQTKAITNTSNEGAYSINATMHYLNLSEYLAPSFEMTEPAPPPLQVSISVNATTIDKNDYLKLSSSVSGNNTPVTYNWDFENDGSIDFNGQNITRQFTQNGSYTINLSIADQEGRTTHIIKSLLVRKVFDVLVYVIDNSSKASLNGIIVELGYKEKNTTGSGLSAISIREGTYDLFIYEEGFRSYGEKIEVDHPITYYANLTPIDVTSPKLVLTSPLPNETLYDNTIEFSFEISDESKTTCTLYTRGGGVLWKLEDIASYTQQGTGSFTLEGLIQGDYEWKIECRDTEGNLNSSEARTFTIDPEAQPNTISQELENKVLQTDEMSNRINDALEELEKMDAKRRSVADQIQFKKTLERALLEIKRATRDINSLKWRKLNDTQLDIETKKIIARVDALRDTTPATFTILESAEFVSYPTDESIATALSIIINDTNKKLTKREITRLLEKNEELQSLLTITTKAILIETEFLYGAKKKQTVINKKIKTGETDFSRMRFFEIIPKTLAPDINDTETFFDYDIIDRDPIIEIDINEIKEYTYILQRQASSKDAEELSSVLVSVDLTTPKKNRITGLSFITSLTEGLAETVDMRLIAEIIIILLLIIVYLVYTIGSVENLKHILDSKEVKYLHGLILGAEEVVEQRQYDQAKEAYKSVVDQYRHLDKDDKEHLKPAIAQLTNNLNLLYINNLLLEADAIMGKDKKLMKTHYQKIQSLYKIIPKTHKAKVHQKCVMLHNSISGKPAQAGTPPQQPQQPN